MSESSVNTSLENPAEYENFRRILSENFSTTSGQVAALFTTDVDTDAMWLVYLGALEERQVHDCSACRHFIKRYGGLVTISADGTMTSAMWGSHWGSHSDIPAYHDAARALRRLVSGSKVTGIFLSEQESWGHPSCSEWSHLQVSQPPGLVFHKTRLTARQKMAELREDFVTISRALGDFDVSVVDQAIVLLKSDALYRSEKVLGAAQWLSDLQRDVAASGASPPWRHRNVTWLAVATAPTGFTHPRTTMIGTLLGDIADGMDFDTAARRFKDKMHPLRYQRPQSAPSAANVAQAEKIVEELKAGGAFNRRVCRLDEVDAVWRPPTATPPTNAAEPAGVFSSVKTRTPRSGARKRQGLPMAVPATVMTWERFRADVLPAADRIQFYAPSGPLSYAMMVTSSDPDATPILQWDNEHRRNPVSWYVWNGGSAPHSFNIEPCQLHDVPAITLSPPHWSGGEELHQHQGQSVFFLVEGACDAVARGRRRGIALFPECLRSDFRPVRKTIEAFSQSEELSYDEGPYAAGLMLSKPTGGNAWPNVRLTVTSGSSLAEYRLDRWS